MVCGAPNLAVGQKVAFALEGAELFDAHNGGRSVLKAAKIRGVVSRGMVCSECELGISDNHEGILVLPEDAPCGEPLADYLGDVIFDLDITPNRADCLSVTGIAREVAALTGKEVKMPPVQYRETGEDINGQVNRRNCRCHAVPAVLRQFGNKRKNRPFAGLAAAAPTGLCRAFHQ